MASAKSSLTREGTMQVTAKEGVQYLESEGKTKLLEMQGLKEPEKQEPAMKRDSTMAATAKEADQLLGKDRPDEDAKTRGQQTKIEEVKAEGPAAAKKPKMAKGVTMAATAKEANQLLGKDKPDEDAKTRGQQTKIEEVKAESAAAAKKPKMAKGVTMAATAKEADQLLGKDRPDEDAKTRGQQTKIEEVKAESSAAAKKPKMAKGVTMAATAKEADQLLGKDRPDEDAKTRGQQTKIEEVKAESSAAAKKPKMTKGVTMVGTAKEAERILGDEKPDADAMTRGQQKKIEEISKEPAPAQKKARMQKDSTMAATAKEAKAHILGKEKLGDTRQQTQATKAPAMKKTSSISKAIEEAKWVVPDINVNEGRKTRSQTNPPKPGMKRAGTMQETAAAGKEFLKRSKKSAKSSEPVEEDQKD